MKSFTKKICLILVMAFCLSLCGCSYVQAGLADTMEDLYGVEGKSFEEHRAYYQAEWDMFFDSIGYLISIVKNSEDGNILEDIVEGIEDLESIEGTDEEPQPTIDWEALAEAKNVTLGNIQDENGYTSCYENGYSKGQCTWYAYGRFAEVTGIDLNLGTGNAKDWLDVCNDDRVYIERDTSKISAPAIAVDYKPKDLGHPGHVTFIEHVTYDEYGNPVDVYFTESNWDTNGRYDEGTDGVVKKLSYSKFINRGTESPHKVIGFIIPK